MILLDRIITSLKLPITRWENRHTYIFIDIDAFPSDILDDLIDTFDRVGIRAFVGRVDGQVKCVRTGKMSDVDRREVKYLIRKALEVNGTRK